MHRQPIRSGHVPARALFATSLLAAALVIGIQSTAVAACHIAGFVEGEVEVDATVHSTSRSVTLTVELQGRVESCEGAVDWATEDGTAKAGTDYVGVNGTLTFVAGDDRVEDITIEILDSGFGDFHVALSNPTGSIAGTGDPATVTIVVDDIQVGSEPGPTDDATSPTGGEETEDNDPVLDDAADDGFPWVPVLLVVIVIAVLAGVLLTRRRPT